MRRVWRLLTVQIILLLCVGCRKTYNPPDGVPLINVVVYPESQIRVVEVDGLRVRTPGGQKHNAVRLSRGVHKIRIEETRTAKSWAFDWEVVTYTVVVETTEEYGYALHGFRRFERDYQWRLYPRRQYEVWRRDLEKIWQKELGVTATIPDVVLHAFDPTGEINDVLSVEDLMRIIEVQRPF